MTDPATGDIVAAQTGAIGSITLNRPRSLNALTTGMTADIARNIKLFDKVGCETVIVRSAHARVFCAGGDIRQIRSYALDGNVDAIATFFSTEYEMDYDIATSPVPVATVVDGVCLGGGLGIFGHSKIRVVTENAVLGMPENAIGFFPDVGASYFLSRLPGAIGMYLALTGRRLSAADALYSGLATHAMASETAANIVDMATGLPPGQSFTNLLSAQHVDIDTARSHLAINRADIDRCFGAPNLAQIFDTLSESPTDWAHRALEELRVLSPQSLRTTFESIEHAADSSLRACLDRDLETALRLTRTPDFIEGVGAKLVDKRVPQWSSRSELAPSSHHVNLEDTCPKP